MSSFDDCEAILMESQHKQGKRQASDLSEPAKHDLDADDLLEEKAKFKFPTLDPIILYACSKCKARYVARFRKGWRTLDSIRGLEPLYSPNLLLCKSCAKFNIEHFLKIDKLN